MSTHKQIEKELKRPDNFQDAILKALDYAGKNKSKLLLMASPLLLVGLVGYCVFLWQNHQAEGRRAGLAKILTMQSDEQTAVAKKTEAIQKEIDTLRTPTQPIVAATDKAPADKAPAPLTAEALLKISELEKQLTNVRPDHTGSVSAFKTFYEANKDVAEGWVAGISWAAAQLEEGKTAEARPVVESIVKASTAHKLFQIQSRFMLAGILEEMGEYDTALKEAEILGGLVEGDAKSMMLLLKGQLLYFKKDLAGARPVLNEIIEKHGSTREAQSARSLLAEIGPA